LDMAFCQAWIQNQQDNFPFDDALFLWQ